MLFVLILDHIKMLCYYFMYAQGKLDISLYFLKIRAAGTQAFQSLLSFRPLAGRKSWLVNYDSFHAANKSVYSLSSFTWWSGNCYLNKREWNLNRSKDDSFVERVAKNNSWNKSDRHKIHEIFLINCFVFVITLVWKAVHGLAMTQIKAHLMEKHCN